MTRRVLRSDQVKERTGLPRSSMYLLMSRDEFPKPIRLSDSGRSVGWIESEVEDWIAARIRQSRNSSQGVQ